MTVDGATSAETDFPIASVVYTLKNAAGSTILANDQITRLDGNKLSFTLTSDGAYTLSATSAATDDFTASSAEMSITVKAYVKPENPDDPNNPENPDDPAKQPKDPKLSFPTASVEATLDETSKVAVTVDGATSAEADFPIASVVYTLKNAAGSTILANDQITRLDGNKLLFTLTAEDSYTLVASSSASELFTAGNAEMTISVLPYVNEKDPVDPALHFEEYTYESNIGKEITITVNTADGFNENVDFSLEGEDSYKITVIDNEDPFSVTLLCPEEAVCLLNASWSGNSLWLPSFAQTAVIFKDGSSTGIVNAETEYDAIYFDLNGNRVGGNILEKGIYIKVLNGKRTKVMVK